MKNTDKLANDVDLDVLFARGEYEQILKDTVDKIDVTSIYYRIRALDALKRYEEASLLLSKVNNIIEKEDLLLTMRLNIFHCLKTENFAHGYELYNAYKEYPYHSQAVEEFVASIPELLKRHMSAQKETEKNEKQGVALIANQLKTFSASPSLLWKIDALTAKDFKKCLPDLLRYLVKEEIHSLFRHSLLTIIYEKNGPSIIDYYHDGKIITLDLEKNPPLVTTKFFNILMTAIDMYHFNVSYVSLAKELAYNYFSYLYPEVPISENINLYGASFILLAANIFKIEDIQKTVINFYKIKEDKLLSLYHQVESVIQKIYSSAKEC